jgi:hypothetical protein
MPTSSSCAPSVTRSSTNGLIKPALGGRRLYEQIDWQLRQGLAVHARSAGAVEGVLTYLRGDVFTRRVHVMRNQERTNRLLKLIQLERNGQADRNRYARIIHDHVLAAAGQSPPRRQIVDRGIGSLQP